MIKAPDVPSPWFTIPNKRKQRLEPTHKKCATFCDYVKTDLGGFIKQTPHVKKTCGLIAITAKMRKAWVRLHFYSSSDVQTVREERTDKFRIELGYGERWQRISSHLSLGWMYIPKEFDSYWKVPFFSTSIYQKKKEKHMWTTDRTRDRCFHIFTSNNCDDFPLKANGNT